MNKGKQIKLIDGHFSKSDAKEILITLINDKISYHSRRNFSHEERFGKPDVHSLARINDLKQEQIKALKYLSEFDDNEQIDISAEVLITAKQNISI